MTSSHHGARWWKFDFHTHTPFSQDWRGPDVSLRDWLLMFMRAEIDCVAVTDHNGGGWIDRLKREYDALKAATNEADFRELVLFPGVEISVQGGVHLLAIFDPSRNQGDIDTLLGAVGYDGTKGDSDAVTTRSLADVAKIIAEKGGVAIPAHSDEAKGLLRRLPTDGSGDSRVAVDANTLRQVLDCDAVYAFELVNPSALLPEVYVQHSRKWTRVLGSDTHRMLSTSSSGPLPRSTWIKMGAPTIAGLRLALMDGSPLSVQCSDETVVDPNRHASLVIQSIEVQDAYLAGRINPMIVRFSPWLNAVIGGRGSGKSTILELLRAALERRDDLPQQLKSAHHDFMQLRHGRSGKGALTDTTTVQVVLQKHGHRSRVLWTAATNAVAIEDEDGNGNWIRTPSVVRERFPLRILSQKEVFALAEDRGSLLRLIDDAPEFDKRQWVDRAKALEAEYLKLRADQRAARAGLGEKARLLGEIADLKRQALVIEKANAQDLLQKFERVEREAVEVAGLEARLKSDIEATRALATQIEGADGETDEGFDKPVAQTQEQAAPTEFSRVMASGEEARASLARQLRATADEGQAVLQRWVASAEYESWTRARMAVEREFDQLKTTLQQSGIASIEQYGSLLARRREAERQLAGIEAAEGTVEKLEKASVSLLEQHRQHRRVLTQKRAEFLDLILAGNERVRISVVAFGDDPSALEPEFRKLIAKEDDKLADDVLTSNDKGILADLFRGLPDERQARVDEFERRLAELRINLRSAAFGVAIPSRTKWFVNHMGTLKPEQLDRLDLWWPEDGLAPEYKRSDGWQPLSNASAGQKSAAILALLLAHGEQPIVIDQPEDDLDSRLTFDLLVKAVRDAKPRRQVIVATHNANVVVNGDAENVVTMNFARGQCQVQEQESGCLQEDGVRDAICRVLEGGPEAFKQRYHRIMGARRV